MRDLEVDLDAKTKKRHELQDNANDLETRRVMFYMASLPGALLSNADELFSITPAQRLKRSWHIFTCKCALNRKIRNLERRIRRTEEKLEVVCDKLFDVCGQMTPIVRRRWLQPDAQQTSQHFLRIAPPRVRSAAPPTPLKSCLRVRATRRVRGYIALAKDEIDIAAFLCDLSRKGKRSRASRKVRFNKKIAMHTF